MPRHKKSCWDDDLSSLWIDMKYKEKLFQKYKNYTDSCTFRATYVKALHLFVKTFSNI